MRKFYYSVIAAFALLPNGINAQKKFDTKGSVTFRLDNSRNNNNPVDTAYIILDRSDLTGAGIVKSKYEVIGNKILFRNLSVGKYYADIFIQGFYKQHFCRMIKVRKKGKTYTFKLPEVDLYNSDTVVIPKESDDYSKTSVVFMK
jgi:hypothetical protein